MSFVSYTPEQNQILDEYSSALRQALTLLYRHLQDGIEFPDAVFKVTQKTGFTSTEVEHLFDRIEEAA